VTSVGPKFLRAAPLPTSAKQSLSRLNSLHHESYTHHTTAIQIPDATIMAPKTIRWGILATGAIAETFTKDLLVDPATRDVHDVKHVVVAAASSSSKSRAEAFLKEVEAGSEAKAYGSYEEFVKDESIDIVYVATPHSHHYQNCMLALEAGKHVLCEKAFTVNAEQLRLLVKKAEEKDRFLMEAVWTRYFPLSVWVRDTITSGKIGHVMRVLADNCQPHVHPDGYDKTDNESRMVNVDLAGGALLDLGIYSLTWVFQCLYTTQPKEQRQKPKVLSFVKPYETGADQLTSIILEFPRNAASGGSAHAFAGTGIVFGSDKPDTPCIRISGTKGEIQVFPPAFRPTKTRLLLADGTQEDKSWPQPGPGVGSGWKNGFLGDFNAEGEGHGMFWEADEAARAVLEGRRGGGKYEDLEESLVIMETMDEVRRAGGMKYPEVIESTEYPLTMKGK
jgi:predicted dehydrogenase